ncbi:hypothetical protein [Myxococcus sp. Y35]|uniref:hypothetical protein n=1 Tax=Pseudomyxococcus flavus TaxID=3115648 RepID=UPI003CF5287D
MPSLFLALCLATVARADATPPWTDHPLMERCFDGAQGFIQAAYGAAGTEDENIRSSPASPLKDGSVWVIDATAGANFQWYLLQPGAGGKLCLTLFVPAAAQVSVRQKGSALAAQAKTQPSPGYPVKQVDFKRAKGAARFTPASCEEFDPAKSGAGSRRKVDCATVFD